MLLISKGLFMGLMVYSLDNIPQNVDRDYFIYLLDYGWNEPISNILQRNFEKMAELSAKNRAVIIKGVGEHFENEVFSWHGINGLRGEDVLPALLITNQHPEYFSKRQQKTNHTRLYLEDDDKNIKLILVPFKKFCTTETEVMRLVEKLFENIESQKDLKDFSILKEIKNRDNLLNTIVLQPNIHGIGIDLKTLLKKLKDKS